MMAGYSYAGSVILWKENPGVSLPRLPWETQSLPRIKSVSALTLEFAAIKMVRNSYQNIRTNGCSQTVHGRRQEGCRGQRETTTLKNLLVEETCYKATKGTRPSTGQSRRSTSRVMVVQSQGHGRILESPRGLTVVMAVQLHGTI